MISIGELLPGTDEDFVINIYLAVLGRWPDEGGFENHLRAIAGRPELRLDVLRSMAGSEEGLQKARPLNPDERPASLECALAAQLRLRAEIPQFRDLTPSAATALAGEVQALGLEVTALGQELRERLAALEATLAGKLPVAPGLSPSVSIEFVSGLIEAAQAPLQHRLRALEKRVLDGG